MPKLISPTVGLHSAWLEAHAEWGPGSHEDGFGLSPNDEIESPAGFREWVEHLADVSGGCTYRWIVERDQVLGGIALRHEFTDFVQWAGHIGYGIRPSARGRGIATWALGQMLDEACLRGMTRVLAVCESGNSASAKTIERQGGVPERQGRSQAGSAWRYWIDLGERRNRPPGAQ